MLFTLGYIIMNITGGHQVIWVINSNTVVLFSGIICILIFLISCLKERNKLTEAVVSPPSNLVLCKTNVHRVNANVEFIQSYVKFCNTNDNVAHVIMWNIIDVLTTTVTKICCFFRMDAERSDMLQSVYTTTVVARCKGCLHKVSIK